MGKKSGRKADQLAGDFDIPVSPNKPTAVDVGTNRPYNNGSAVVSFTYPSGNAPVSSYTVISSPGGFTEVGTSSPITIIGLQSGIS